MSKSTADNTNKHITFCTKNILTTVAEVFVQEPFCFDLFFAVTVNKATGRTVKRVAVDLAQHQCHCCSMKNAAIFLAMSPVAEMNHTRLLEPNTLEQCKSLCECRSSIQPQKHIASFLHGCSEDGLPLSPNKPFNFLAF